jgi:hypothetical protein
MIGTSCRISWRSTTSGVISADRPRMNSTLKMLLPTTLPTARSVWPDSAAPTDTATSGALVPKATTVSPTTSGDRPNDSASFDAPRTSSSAPATRPTRPAMNNPAVISMERGPQCAAGGWAAGCMMRSAIAMASAENRKAMWMMVCQISTFSV